MTKSYNDDYVNKLILRDEKRKQNVKLYFTRKSHKYNVYEKYFNTHASNDEKKQLKNELSKMTL